MHPYVIDRLVQERRDELARMARAEGDVRAARLAATAPRPPRRLVALAAALAAVMRRVPRSAREDAGVTAVLQPRPRSASRPC